METLHRQVLNQMGEQICSGKFAPGDILPAEPVLAEQMQVSRITIRETMKSLSAKGMLQVRRRYGTIVLPRSQWQLFDPDVITWRARAGTVDAGLIQDLMELRLIIEPNAAKLAARRATDEDRVAVRRAFKAMERAVAGHGEYVPADLAFHGAILTACHNQFVQQMQNALSAILRTSFELSSEIAGGPARSLPMHEALCVAIEKGDEAAAEAAVLTLIERAEKDFEDRDKLRQTANDTPV
ncbi:MULTISPECIES: FadR/GntR family transcriptional regulator [Paraburkholderia]|jgi:DNA-binding FadR family transcriptional regulator|uniref:GntR family transcriptional regulator n=5 Tax=Paraburkholderia TaxID=1822464 RepID=A0A4R0XEJ1_9BURK|nr:MULTISPECIES: FadR/GntR family transcriptional regulator [Paraburkholderia]EUC12992.1 GntR domain protein [Burkholderia sp. BT03]TCG07195.1 GntR family transcriptional regulator [Paraburkholderia steynii]AUT72403.1 FadR family transcriptional regulator [Paraburkholderia hospita]AUT76235.1 FadR family transcriptional regulator [Paraburkholderia hospita]AXF00848.1 FadR family transcriptional regulator [Paraburkholderia hospita]